MLALPCLVAAQTTTRIPVEITTPDEVESRIGTLEYQDGVPTVEPAERVRDTLDFTRALNLIENLIQNPIIQTLIKRIKQ